MQNKYISGHYAEGNKPDRERQIRISLIYDIKKKIKPIETESKEVLSRCEKWGEVDKRE